MNKKVKTRLNRITTKTGDQGETSLADGKRLAKSDIVFEVLGDIDELNVTIGLLSCNLVSKNELQLCNWLQHKLFNFGGELSFPDNQLISSEDVDQLEKWIENYNSLLAPLKEFVLPNGNLSSVYAHLSRTVCRRCERHFCVLTEQKKLSKYLLIFLNRLSDLFFVLARYLSLQNENSEANYFTEEEWEK